MLLFRVEHSKSGRVMEVYTNQPGLQFYTGNFLDIDSGKNGKSYKKHDAFCMEPQNYPDAPNHVSLTLITHLIYLIRNMTPSV